MIGNRSDPYRGYNFSVSLTDSTSALSIAFSLSSSPPIGSFSECSGLEKTLQTEDYPEGGNNGRVRRFPSRVTWSNIRLRRGVTGNDQLWLWHDGFVQGAGKRRDGVITLLDEQQNPVKVWRFERGLPVKCVAPSFNANQSAVAIEELEIGHEGIRLLKSGLFGLF
jgi:phage tail-like protein